MRLCWKGGGGGLASWVELILPIGLVGASCGETLLWVWVALLVACWAMMIFKTSETQLWVWRVLLVAGFAVTNSVASVGQVTLVEEWVAVAVSLEGPFSIVTLLWVWVALLVVCWAVVGADAFVEQVTQVVLATVVGVVSVGTLLWVWVALLVACWAVISPDVSVGQVTRMVEFVAVLAPMTIIGGDW
jgi:hypothetical protein